LHLIALYTAALFNVATPNKRVIFSAFNIIVLKRFPLAPLVPATAADKNEIEEFQHTDFLKNRLIQACLV
jgi:hypothetical protein